MFCTNCGAPREPNADFCTRCGSRFPQNSPEPADIDSFVDPDELILAGHTVAALGEPAARALLHVTNRCLRLAFPAVDTPDRPNAFWKIPFHDIVQVYLRQDSAKTAVAVTLVSKNTISGPVPANLRNRDWLRQNRDAIKRGEVGVEEVTAPVGRGRAGGRITIRAGRPGNQPVEKKIFSYRLPEGWFFDQSGCCLSLYLLDTSPEEADKLFAGIFVIRDTGEIPRSYASSTQGSSGLQHWRASDEPLLWQWQGKLAATSWWSKIIARINLISESKISLTHRRLIVEVPRRDRVAELSEFPIESLRSICWVGNQRTRELKVLADGPPLMSPTSIQARNRAVLSSHATVKVSSDPTSRLTARFDGNSPETNRTIESLGSMILLALQGRSLEEVSEEKEGMRARLTKGEEVACSSRLSAAQDVGTEVWLTNRRLLLHSSSKPPPLSSIFRPRNILSDPMLRIQGVFAGLVALFVLSHALSELSQWHIASFLSGLVAAPVGFCLLLAVFNWPIVLPRLLGRESRSFARSDVFADKETRISALPLSRENSALVVSWGSDPLNADQLRQAFQKAPHVWRLAGMSPQSIEKLGEFQNCLVFPAARDEADAVAAELTRHLLAAQEGLSE